MSRSTQTANAPVRIAYLTGEYPAVSHTFILREVEALRTAGLPVETCSIRRTGPEHHRGPAEQEAARTTFYVLAAARNPLRIFGALAAALRRPGRFFATLSLAWRMRAPGIRAGLYQLIYFLEAAVLARHLATGHITHLHNHFAGPSATVSMLAARLAGIPFSFTLHGPADFEDPLRWRLDLKVAEAEFVACISHFARSQAMLRADPAHWHKLRIVHCGVRPAHYAPSVADTDRDGTQLVFVGRLAAVKGLRVLFEALHSARDRAPGLSLTLIGDGPERNELELAAAPLGDSIRFLGYRSQSEVAEVLAEADILVLPSFAEGVPVVLMEAMASGKPVIATRVGGVSELVEDGVSGFLVAPGDAASLADRIVDLAQDPALRQRMGVAGREKVHAEFDIDREALWLATLFRAQGGAHLRQPC